MDMIEMLGPDSVLILLVFVICYLGLAILFFRR